MIPPLRMPRAIQVPRKSPILPEGSSRLVTQTWLDFFNWIYELLKRQPMLNMTWAATLEVDANAAAVQQVTVTANTLFAAPLNATPGKRLTLFILQDSVGGWTITFDAAWGISPTFTTTLNTWSILDGYFDEAGSFRYLFTTGRTG